VAFHIRLLTATSSERTGAMPAINCRRMPEARLGERLGTLGRDEFEQPRAQLGRAGFVLGQLSQLLQQQLVLPRPVDGCHRIVGALAPEIGARRWNMRMNWSVAVSRQ
jgi:hypothetical protein